MRRHKPRNSWCPHSLRRRPRRGNGEFGRASVTLHEITVAVELRDVGTPLRFAATYRLAVPQCHGRVAERPLDLTKASH